MSSDQVRPVPPPISWRLPSLLPASIAPAPPALSGGRQRPAGNAPAAAPAAEQAARSVAVVKPERKALRRAVGQPGSIQAFERTSIMAKIPGYVHKWHVDLGDRVRKGDVLAEL